MTLKQAKVLRHGDRIRALLTDPHGGESHWSTKEESWIYEPVNAGQVVIFRELIPKVRIVRHGPWNDGHDQMLFCRTEGGQRAWFNIGNARREKT